MMETESQDTVSGHFDLRVKSFEPLFIKDGVPTISLHVKPAGFNIPLDRPFQHEEYFFATGPLAERMAIERHRDLTVDVKNHEIFAYTAREIGHDVPLAKLDDIVRRSLTVSNPESERQISEKTKVLVSEGVTSFKFPNNLKVTSYTYDKNGDEFSSESLLFPSEVDIIIALDNTPSRKSLDSLQKYARHEFLVVQSDLREAQDEKRAYEIGIYKENLQQSEDLVSRLYRLHKNNVTTLFTSAASLDDVITMSEYNLQLPSIEKDRISHAVINVTVGQIDETNTAVAILLQTFPDENFIASKSIVIKSLHAFNVETAYLKATALALEFAKSSQVQRVVVKIPSADVVNVLSGDSNSVSLRTKKLLKAIDNRTTPLIDVRFEHVIRPVDRSPGICLVEAITRRHHQCDPTLDVVRFPSKPSQYLAPSR